MRVKANGIFINYELNGKGENLVLIHGAGDNLNMWYHQVPDFSKSYRVISYDFRGAGKSECPKGDYSISIFAEDAYQLMKTLGVSKAVFLGFSIGARIALEIALIRPELVKALILVSSALGITSSSPSTVERRRVNLELLDKGDMESVVERMTTTAFSPDFRAKNPADFNEYLKVKLQNGAEGLARLYRGMALPTAPPDLSKVNCPVLLIAGENDQYMTLEPVKEAHKAIVGSKVEILPAGHAAPIELPKRFNAIVLEFLSSTSRL